VNSELQMTEDKAKKLLFWHFTIELAEYSAKPVEEVIAKLEAEAETDAVASSLRRTRHSVNILRYTSTVILLRLNQKLNC
jgi:hypothetical protein